MDHRSFDFARDEAMFGNLKTKGFNPEDPHPANADRLSTLLAGLALAVALVVKAGVAAARRRPIPIKQHGRRAGSPFALGRSVLRQSSPPRILPK
jgi:hypothetical protein